ncbi:MAG: carbohydrate ABC transporter permease [Lachnospiraceae bacterium]|nr:carbohydrate ABC transporter permease [Lachnospiraceae bacterium]
MKRRKSIGSRIFDTLNTLFFIFIMIVCILPIWHVVCASFSEATWVMKQTGIIYRIQNFNLNGYKLVFENREIWSGYLNTILYCFFVTVIGLLVVVLVAYVTAQRNLLWSNAIMLFASFTMLFNGGIISSYLVNTQLLNMYNSRWAIILPSCFNVFYLILVRTAIRTVPDSLVESAKLDGAGDMTILFRIVLPLIKATIATVILYYIVAQWNSWFSATIYLRTRTKLPLQIIIKEILVTGDTSSMANAMSTMDNTGDMTMYKQLIKYCTIVVSTLPIFILYPFIQKYFESGVMIGAVKG